MVCTNTSLCVAGPTVQLNSGDREQFEGSCTDKTWNSPLCPSFCRTGELSKNAANGVWNCTSGRYCCSAFGGDSDCCQRGTDVFFLGDYANITTIGDAVEPGFSTSTSSSIQSSTSLPITTTSAANTAFPITSTTSTTAQRTSSPTPTSTAQVVGGGPELGAGAAAGIAVGVAVVVAGLALLGFFHYQQRNKTNKLKAQMELLQRTSETGDSRQEVSVYRAKDQYYKDTPIQTAYEVETRHGMVEVAGQGEIAEANAEREVGELPAETRRNF